MRYIIASLAVLMLSCGGHSISGTLTLNDYMGSAQEIGGPCTGRQGYADISAGTAVVVKDEAGKVLATGTLGGGHALDQLTCEFPITLTGVADAKFYQIEVAHRGAITYSKEDLDKKGWKIGLTLG